MFAVLLVALPLAVFARDQTVGVRGSLMCGNQPLSGATVKLWDINKFPFPDTNMATVTTNGNGQFDLRGTVNDLTTADPTIRIYHNCDNNWTPRRPIASACQRESQYAIPKQYIANGRNVNQYYDMGMMNMQARQPGEDSHCFSNPLRSIGKRQISPLRFVVRK